MNLTELTGQLQVRGAIILGSGMLGRTIGCKLKSLHVDNDLITFVAFEDFAEGVLLDYCKVCHYIALSRLLVSERKPYVFIAVADHLPAILYSLEQAGYQKYNDYI